MNNALMLTKKLKIHFFTWILIALSLITAQFREIATLFMIVCVHEFGHGLAAMHYGWHIDKLLLLPFGGEMVTNDFGHKAWHEELVVVLAGPLQHVLMFLFCLIFKYVNLFPSEALIFFERLNLILFITNLLPIWPLDGGKIVFIILARYLSFIKAHTYTIYISIIFLVALVGKNLLTWQINFNDWIFVVFLCVSLVTEFKQHRYYFMKFLLRKGETVEKKHCELQVYAWESLGAVVKKLRKNYQHDIIVYDQHKSIGVLTEKKILEAYFSHSNPNLQIKQLIC